ncbi:phage protein [Streptococcus equi subsp. equi]|uniref:Phage protein n=1 Tax=Streptococcus equi subsp. equi TaxID=148942 RepID=A0A380JM66_9STRE|nr:hypothetical protein [Streptococcus equi]SUN44705.1 phage protein [Streptococcus equi subsp. equi]
MAVQEIKDTFFYKIDGQTVGYSLLPKSGLSPGQFYITISDRYNFDAGRDVDIYKIISSTQADVYKANKYNYQSLATPSPSEMPSTPKNDSLYQSITIDGRAIGRVICNNKVIWRLKSLYQKTVTTNAVMDIYKRAKTIYIYIPLSDIDNVINDINAFKLVAINNVSLSSSAKVYIYKKSSKYNISILQLDNASDIQNSTENKLLFEKLGGNN